MAGEGRRARLFEEEVLAAAQDLQRDRRVIDGSGGEDDRLDVAPRAELRVRAGIDAEVARDLRGAPRPGGRHGDELAAAEPREGRRVQRSHPAQAGDADADRSQPS